MPNPMIAMAGASAVGGIAQGIAGMSAAKSQERTAREGIEEQRRQFDKVQELLSPFVEGGTDAFGDLLGLMGLQGDEVQAEAIQAIEQGPEFAALIDQGEQAILANASATGGLRGGNTQAALAQYRPQVLSSLLTDRYNKLLSVGSVGQSSAAGVGSAAQAMGNNVTQLLGDIGAAQAGGALAVGRGISSAVGGISNALGYYSANAPEGATMFGKWGF